MHFSGETQLPEVTEEELERALETVRPFTIVVLKAGPNYQTPGSGRDTEVAETIREHGKRNFALRLAGFQPIVCPVADGSGITGVGIFDAGTEDVERIMSSDPGVQAGIFTYDVHPTHTFPGSALPP